MGNENSSSTKNSVSSLPPICINDNRKNVMIRAARRSSDQRQNQIYNHNHSQNSAQPSFPHRHSTSNTHLNSVVHLEPQRKYSQCQPGRYVEDLSRQQQRHISDSQCSLSASPSAYSYRSRASFAGPLSQSPVPPPLSASPQPRPHFTHFYSNQPPTSKTNRRMSVDESQQRRQARTASATPSGPATMKLSLAGFHGLTINNSGPMDDPLGGNQVSARSRTNKSARDQGDDSGGISLQEHLKLTSYQTLMLTQTWPRIKSSVFNGVFRELSQKCPKVKELFQKTSIVGGFSAAKCVDMKEHIKQLVELYDASLQELTAPCKNIKEKCVLVGETHFAIAGPSSSGIWDDFGVCLTEAISKADAVRGKREAFKAYIVLTSFLVDSMKAGYMTQAKRKSLSRSTVNGHAAQNAR